MLTIVALLVCLLVLPFIIATVGAGLLALTAILGVLAMPFLWILSVLRTNH